MKSPRPSATRRSLGPSAVDLQRSLPAASVQDEGVVAGDIDPLLIEAARSYLDLRARGQPPGAKLVAAWDRFYGDLAPFVDSAVRACRASEVDHDDATQEVWLKIVSRMGEHRHDQARGRFLAWLFVLTRHHLSDLARRAAMRRAAPLTFEIHDSLTASDGDPAVAYERETDREEVREALGRPALFASAADQRMMHLRWVDGWSITEVAAALGMTPGQARLRHHRALKRLRRLINRDHEGPEAREIPGKPDDPV